MKPRYSLRHSLSPRRFYQSLMHALRGVQRLFSSTPNAAIHLIFTIAVIVSGILLGISAMEWCLLLLCIGAVCALEALNTALESLADRVSRDYSPLIRDAKDLAAGAVLIMSVISALIGLIIFLPHILDHIRILMR